MRTPLVWRLRVTISPWNSWPDFLNEPMLAMSLLLAVFELRDHRGLDGDLKAEGDRRRTRLGRSAAEDGGGETFLPREEWAKPRGRKSHRRHCGSDDRGVAGLRPDQANERLGARVRWTAFRRRASERSAHTRSPAFPAKEKQTWRAERRHRFYRADRSQRMDW